MTENAVVFTANGIFRRLIAQGKEENKLSLIEHAMVGGMSGIFSATAICPPEVSGPISLYSFSNLSKGYKM